MKRMLAVAALAAVVIPSASASGPISTAVFLTENSALAASRIHEAGATFARINVSWADVAPIGLTVGFSPSDPADPRYDWTSVDAEVEKAVQDGLTPYLTVYDAPLWAQKDEPHPTHMGPFPIRSWKPDPQRVGQFVHAVALRYSGSYSGLPRVRYFEAWNESNLSEYLSPQLEHGKIVVDDIYRRLLNAFATAVHAVHVDNVLVAASLSAFSFKTPYGRLGISPMEFLRKLLCMSAGAAPRPTCSTTVDMDAVSIHPWTSGGPTHHASESGDISLGDLPKLHRLLVAAARAGHIRSRRVPPLWITEFAWDTKPPDTHRDTAPIALQSRWVSEAVYQAWKNDVRVFTWLQLWDERYPGRSLQSGLFFRNGEEFRYARPKPTFYAFRFPFVAYRKGKRVSMWGRTPYGRAGQVVIQQRTAKSWRFVHTFTTNRYGIFSGTVPYTRTAPPEHRPRPLSAAATYRNLVVSAHPMSYWPLDEQANRTAADVTTQNDGTYAGGVGLGFPGPFPRTTAADFNGKSGRVKLGPVTNVATAELWVQTRATNDAAAFSNRDSIHRFLDLGVFGGLAHSQDGYPINGASVADGRWHYLAYTYDRTTSTGSLYVDGKLSQLATWPREEGGASASIGYDADVKSYFAGLIAHVAVYSYPLSAAQIRSHYLASGRRIPADAAVGTLRAVELGSQSVSLPFSLIRPRDRYVLPFGAGGD